MKPTDLLKEILLFSEFISQIIKITFRISLILLLGFIIISTTSFGNDILPKPDVIDNIAKTYEIAYNHYTIDSYVQPEEVILISDRIKENSNSEIEYITEIEKFMDKNFVYTSDDDIYRKSEVWKTPQRTLLDDMRGDCEDSAIFVDSILNNLINESWIVIGDEHAYNFLCINEKPIIYDITYYMDDEDEIYEYLEEYRLFYIFNHRTDDAFNRNFDEIPCLNVSRLY